MRALIAAGAAVAVAGAGLTTALFAVPGHRAPSPLAVVTRALTETQGHGKVVM